MFALSTARKVPLGQWTVTNSSSSIRADAQLYVVTGWSWQGLGEVGRVVELTAATDRHSSDNPTVGQQDGI